MPKCMETIVDWRRMLNCDLKNHQLFDVYIKEVISILEVAVPVLDTLLTKQQIKS